MMQMAEANRDSYNKLLKRTDVLDRKQPLTDDGRTVRGTETLDADKAGYYELLRKAQRSRETTSFKG
jgi:hypothetical protein